MSIKKLLAKTVFILSAGYLSLIGIGLLCSDALIFLPPEPGYDNAEDIISIKTRTAHTESTYHKIVARHYHNPASRYTIIYNHGNAVDMSGLIHLQQDFIDHGYSIIVYDYSGYGLSESFASEQQVYNDAQAVYDYLTMKQNIRPQDIIIYGHSLGAAVATDLASKNKAAALVLESPFVTAFRVKTVYPLLPFDKFSSIDKINHINSPLFVTHSRDDPVIPFWHGETMYDTAAEPKTSLWFENAGHSGVTHRNRFWLKMKSFTAGLN